MTIGDASLRILSIEGLEAPPSQVSIAKGPGMDGAIAITPRLEPRHIMIVALLNLEGLDDIEIAETRKKLCEELSVTNNPGELTVERYGRSRRIEAMPCSAPLFGTILRHQSWQRVTMQFLCTQPLFTDLEPTIISLHFYAAYSEVSEEGSAILEEGIELTRIEQSSSRTTMIENKGNQAAAVHIQFTGPMVNPYVKNLTTGEQVRISQVLQHEEYIEIDTEPGKRQIQIHQQGTARNGMHYLDLSSSFWKILPGKNTIEIGDESPGEGSEAVFSFYGTYLEA